MPLHPDFEFEYQRLSYTTEYMERLLEESKRDVKSSQDEIQRSLADLDYLDSSMSFINILTNTRFFEMARSQKEGLEAIRKKPYFARIHLKNEGGKDELLYIGKTSLFHRETQEPIIVDWRSPVANVYYDGRLGELTYQVNEDEIAGTLLSKRQYQIEDGKLLDIRDIDLTTNDELLQEALSGKADVRLTEIISTIQSEQNVIIRANLKQPILVQGAAGSGKTTIALHRISYFLYTMGQDFPANKLMILAPSKLFMDYIADVLPELGVGDICQTTYAEYVLNATSLKVKLTDPNAKLKELTQLDGLDSQRIFLNRVKGTMQYKEMMQRYVTKLEEQVAELFEDIYIEKYRIMKGSKLRKLFLNDLSYLPLEKRFDRIKVIIKGDIKRKHKQLLTMLTAKYDDALDRALYRIRNDEKRKAKLTLILDEREERMPLIEKEGKTVATRYMSRFKKFNVKKIYREWLTNNALQLELAPHWSVNEQTSFYDSHQKEFWELEDLAAIYYLHAKLKGISDEWKMRVVFIDEVQDYSEFQLASLKEGLETDMFTMVGDLAQGIHSYRSLTSWEPIRSLFERATYTTLLKSYRTTIEIMNLANTVLAQMEEDLPLVEPVVRHGESPFYHELKKIEGGKIQQIYGEILSRGYHSVALICKTENDAKKIYSKMSATDLPIQLLGEHSDIDERCLLIVPSHLAKGLEFDAVLIATMDDPFLDHPIDWKLLYVAMTRPMHELHLLTPITLL